MILKFIKIVRETKNVRSYFDMRIKINETIVEYLGLDGHIYRKCFESKSTPKIPDVGTHEELNSQRKQWS